MRKIIFLHTNFDVWIYGKSQTKTKPRFFFIPNYWFLEKVEEIFLVAGFSCAFILFLIVNFILCTFSVMTSNEKERNVDGNLAARMLTKE
jgi:hypothetical protein